jgi:DNA-binding transcriptional ArsR family regulator
MSDSAHPNQRALKEVLRIARAVNHPTRLLILARLADGRTSASDIAQILGMSVSHISYHMKVLREDCEIVEIVDTREVRGAIEYLFELKGSPLDLVVANFVAALQPDLTDQEREKLIIVGSFHVDNNGWNEIRSALENTQATINRVQARSQNRARVSKSEHQRVSFVTGIGAAAKIASQSDDEKC